MVHLREHSLTHSLKLIFYLFYQKGGASASFFNHKLGCAPIHVAAEEGEPEKLLLLLKV